MHSSRGDTRPISETSSLLKESSTSSIYGPKRRLTFPKTSIFSCAVICILFTVLCERMTFYGINENIFLFATQSDHLNMSPTQASILALVFQGTSFTLPILGGWLADSKAGKFATILFSAIIYLIGAILIPIGSITEKNDEGSEWAADHVTSSTALKKTFYITGLFLVAFGVGGIKANLSPFGAEQVSNRGPATIQAFFSLFYWFINFGALLAFTFVLYIQQNISFFYGYIIPAGSLVFALVFFLVGNQTYSIRPPTGSVLSTTLRIFKEAIKKSYRPSLSKSFENHWLDRAKMCFGGSFRSWEVEDVKKVYKLLPIFATFALYWTIYNQMNTSMLYQAEYMDIKLHNFIIPIASLSIFGVLGILILIPFMEKLIYPLLGNFGICPSQLQRIGWGMIFATASMACAGGIEWYRVDKCCILEDRGEKNLTEVSSITVLYQIPQYTLLGVSEVLTSITGLEIAYTEAPKSLQGIIMGMHHLSTGLGAFIAAILLLFVEAVTKTKSDANKKWYPDKDQINNKGHYLAYYFFFLTVLMFLNFILYIFVALKFNSKKEYVNISSLSKEDTNAGVLSDKTSALEESLTTTNHESSV